MPRHIPHSKPQAKKNSPRGRSVHPSNEKAPRQHVGLFTSKLGGGYLGPCHRKDPFSGTFINSHQAKGMKDNDVIIYTLDRNSEFHFIKNLGSIYESKNFSNMAIYAYYLPHTFSDEAQNIANQGKVPSLENRTDLRSLPLVTIDGADAKDFDDAVYAESDLDPRNEGGWRAVVAIADVSYYVQPEYRLDQEAQKRGNSVYFVDKVVPMLPEKLSNDLCSLRPNEDRACIAVDMIISKDGKLKSYRFKRALMRSHARLTYEQVEKAINGKTDQTTEPLLNSVLIPLYNCYKSLRKARDNRGTINVDSCENNFQLNPDGSIKAIQPRKRLESHQIIEELMIIANVAAAKALQAKDWPCAYRVHERPDRMRLQRLHTLAKNFKIPTRKFSATNVIGAINEIINHANGTPYARLFNELVLRSQSQARYSPYNTGHFGLNLSYYCHFTSPIRRYADLLVHRALVAALELDGHKHAPFEGDLQQVCDYISRTERIAMEAEREVQDRFMADYLKDHLGEVFEGTIIGVGIPGIFVELDKIGAQGFIAKQDLSGDFFVLNENEHCYLGKRTKKTYRLGDRIKVLVTNADPITCSIGFALHTENKKTEKFKTKSSMIRSSKAENGKNQPSNTKNPIQRFSPKKSKSKQNPRQR
jgi:ribonuclease R